LVQRAEVLTLTKYKLNRIRTDFVEQGKLQAGDIPALLEHIDILTQDRDKAFTEVQFEIKKDIGEAREVARKFMLTLKEIIKVDGWESLYPKGPLIARKALYELPDWLLDGGRKRRLSRPPEL
jgi:hypothetical protein